MNKVVVTIVMIGFLSLEAAVQLSVAQVNDVRYFIEDLGTLSSNPTATSTATGINSIGQVCGVSQTDSGQMLPYIWTNGTMQSLGTFGTVQLLTAADINDLGWVSGSLRTASGRTHAAARWSVRRRFDDLLRPFGVKLFQLVLGIGSCLSERNSLAVRVLGV